jgi:hypothetical protein
VKTIVIRVLLCFVLVAQAVGAQKHTLTDLTNLDIEVEDLTEFDKSMGLSKDSLRSLILVEVKRNIPRINVEKSTTGAYVYVRITTSEASEYSHTAASFVSVQIVRPVKILSDNLDSVVGSVLAPVWEKGAVLVGPTSTMASRIRQDISEKLTEFAAEYYRQNP